MNTIKDIEEKVPYDVILREDRIWDKTMSTIICSGRFRAYLVNNNNGCFYFEELKGRMLIVVPYNAVEFMAPSKIWWNKYWETKNEM